MSGMSSVPNPSASSISLRSTSESVEDWAAARVVVAGVVVGVMDDIRVVVGTVEVEVVVEAGAVAVSSDGPASEALRYTYPPGVRLPPSGRGGTYNPHAAADRSEFRQPTQHRSTIRLQRCISAATHRSDMTEIDTGSLSVHVDE